MSKLERLRVALALHGRMVVLRQRGRLSWCPAESPRGRALTEHMPPSVLGIFDATATPNELREALQ